MKFKPGDYVICIDFQDLYHIDTKELKNKILTVLSIDSDGTIQIKLCDIKFWFLSKRFKLAGNKFKKLREIL
jgi:hypothetical protein